MRDQLLEGLERYFAEFPPEVAEAIHQELLRSDGLPGLLKRLNLPATGDPSAQYASIIKLLRQAGLRPLENLAGRTLSGPIDRDAYEQALDSTRRLDAEHTKVQTPGPDVKTYQVPQLPAKKNDSGSNSANRIPVVQSPKVKQPPANTEAAPEPQSKPFPMGPLQPGPAPTPGTFDARTPSWDPKKPNNPEGEWPAVERRSGRERRKGPRRNEVDIIYRNRRFGKDRRAESERRRNWPKDGHQP